MPSARPTRQASRWEVPSIPAVRPLNALASAPVAFPVETRPMLLVVVDTEEEFDWDAPFSRSATQVTAIREVARLQRVTRRYGVKPTYVIDYPIATSVMAIDALGLFAHAGECSIGAHLHPWVTPPFEEAVSGPNSFACNLHARLERRKIQVLYDAIARNFAIACRSYKAGRYGFANSTAETLEALGFDVDLSINPRMDFSASGGPSFAAYDARPFTFGRRRTLLEIPCTTAFIGLARAAGAGLHDMASSDIGRRLHVPGVLARLGILNKVMLSPEGFTLAEMQALARQLYDDGVRTFSLTLHSPSLAPGHTPYVRTAADVDRLLDTIDRFMAFFFETLGGVAATPAGLYDLACREAP